MKKIFLLATAVAALGFTSCDIDDVENIYESSQSQFPKTEEDAEAVLAGVYQNLNETHANPQMSFLYYACLASDDQLGGGGANDKLMQAHDLILTSDYDMTNQFYTDRYKGVSRANVLLGVLPENPTSDVQKRAKGEALALRAFYYYELASMYGNVPLILSADDADNKQGDVNVLWGQILQDLRDAADMIPEGTKRDGHIDKYTAEGLLARAWLFYTGMYGNGSDIAALTSTSYNPLTSVTLPDGTTLTKQDVIGYLEDCVLFSDYDLVPDYRNLWAYTNRCTAADYDYVKNAKDANGNPAKLQWVEDDGATNPESMFAIKFNKQASWSTTIGYANGIALHFGVRNDNKYAASFPFGTGWGAGPVAENLVIDWKKAEPNDIRLDASIVDWRSYPDYYASSSSDFVQETDFYGKKWSPITSKRPDIVDEKEGTVTPDFAPTFENDMYPGGWEISGVDNFQLGNIHDLVLLRFSDILLMHAELTDGKDLLEIDGKKLNGLNAVRVRVGLPEVPYSLQALQNERRWEFACEGIRWNDIRRWHIAAAALAKQENTNCYVGGTATKNTAHNGGYAARYNATAGFHKMPESQVSLGVVEQNPGWTDNTSEYSQW